LGENEQKSEKYPPVWGTSEYVHFFWACLMNCQILDLVEAVLSALMLSQTAWHDWSTTLARVNRKLRAQVCSRVSKSLLYSTAWYYMYILTPYGQIVIAQPETAGTGA